MHAQSNLNVERDVLPKTVAILVYMLGQSNLNAERDFLPKVQRTAVAILEGSNAHISKPTPVPDTSSMLSFPHDIIAPIMKLPEGIRQEFLGCFTNRQNEQERFLSFFRSTYSMARNANDLNAPEKHQRKNRSGKGTFNNVSAYGCSHVSVSQSQF